MDTTTLGTSHSGERLKTSFVKIAISCIVAIQLYCCWTGVEMCIERCIWNPSSQRDDCFSYPLLLLRSKFTIFVSSVKMDLGHLNIFPSDLSCCLGFVRRGY